MTLFKRMTGLLILVTCLVSANSLSAAPSGARTRLNMNTNWAFYRGDIAGGHQYTLEDENWIPVVLPHCMQLEKKHCGGNGIYDGIGWYRRYFKLPDAYKNKRICIVFEGVMTACDVYLNGQKVTDNQGGYIGFVADISDRIRWGENNVLAVRVDAGPNPLIPPGKPQDKMDFYYYSGIYRDVSMLISDKLHITDALEEDEVAGGGVFVTYPHVSETKATVRIRTHLHNGHPAPARGKLYTSLIDKTGKVVSTQTTSFAIGCKEKSYILQELTVKKPSLWHPYAPHLYTLSCRVVAKGQTIDEYTQQIGIRTIRFSTDNGFFINGEKLYLRGANRHQAFAHVGDAASNSMQEREVIDMKRGGFNAVRAAHYPHDPAFLEACDKYGLLVVECIPGWQYFNNDPVFSQRVLEVGRRMVRRDRNHPSIILWETALNETRYPAQLAEKIQAQTHAEYPGDQFYTAGDYFGHEDMTDFFDVFYKQVARFPKDGNVMSNYPEDFIAVKPLLTREWGDGVGEKPRVSLTENEEEQMKQCRSRIHQLNGNGYFDWCRLDANPHMGGHFVWSYNDYARGCCDETLFCGVADINRYPKFCYYLLQSMRDKDISQAGLYEGPMVYIASYNASASFSSSTTDITVFSNCDAVKLYRNGQWIGTQTRMERQDKYKAVMEKGGSPSFVFDAGGYEAGQLTAEGLIDGNVVAIHRVQTPQQGDHIEISIHDNGIAPVADGSDMIPVYFKVCDKNGTRIPDSDAVIHISVSGEGSLIGDGIQRIGINPQQVEGGVGFAFIRTTGRNGEIHISASSENLRSGTATIRTEPFTGEYVPDGIHASFTGQEENGVTVKPTTWEKSVLSRPVLPVKEVLVSSNRPDYPATHITDGDDRSWWIAANDSFPQVIELTLDQKTPVSASRILFQKDSSSYKHRVEISEDGENWTLLYERECTGWDFKPYPVDKNIKKLRLTIQQASEGRAGLGEITLFGK